MKIKDLRSLFPIVERTLYFDAASLSPYCVPVIRALEKFAQERRDFASTYYDIWYEKIDESRKIAANLIKADYKEIAFAKNTSEGVNLTAQMVDWKKGDEVVVCACDFPTNILPFLNLRSKGIKVNYVSCKDGKVPLERIERTISVKTKLLSISHVFYNSGYRIDLEEIGGICKENETLFHVDAAQSLGAFKIDVKKAGIDFLSSCGFKWLLSPLGTGIYFVKSEHLDKTPVLGWLSVKEPKKLDTREYEVLDSAKRFEAVSLNIGGFLGMRAALKLIDSIGIDKIEKRLLELSLYLGRELESAGLKVHSDLNEKRRSGIVCIDKGSLNSDFLTKKGICATIRNNLRMAPHVYNNEEDIDMLVRKLTGR